MSNENESEAVLRLRIVENLAEVARDLDRFREGTGDADRDMRKLGKTVNDAIDDFRGLGKAGKAAGKQVGDSAAEASDEWKALAERVNDAAQAYRAFRKDVAAGVRPDMSREDWMATNGVSGSDLASYRQGMSANLVGEDAQSLRDQERMLDQIAASHQRNASIRHQAAEADRQAQWTSIQNAKLQATQEERITAEIRQQALMRANASNAFNASSARSGSFMSQGESGLRAADTSWARADAVRMEEARRALADYDKQLNSNTAGYSAASSALANMLRAEEEQLNTLPRLRYALYDVGLTLAVTGAAMTAFGVVTAATAIRMQREFADVIRTTGAYLDPTGRSVNALRGEFEELFATMPTSWAQLSEIGTLAGQLDVAMGDVDEFTKLIAMFSATTDVSVEASATAFGRLAQLLGITADEYENMGSSILAVGVSSVATESQIIAISKEIASITATAGFSADQVFGLSSALASLGTQPELSRGVITRLFANIGRSVQEGSESLEVFGSLAKMSGQDFARAWGEDASDALLKLMQGLGQIEGSEAIGVLSDLGIEASRDVPTLLRLAQNSDVLARSLKTAADGYADGSMLAEQYSVISSTVSEKLNILVNNFQLLVATFGEAAGGAGFLVDALIAVTRGITTIMDNPIAATIAGITLAITTLGGILLVLVGLVTRGIASIYAMRTAMAEMGLSASTSAFSVGSLTTALLGQEVAAGKAAVASRVAGIAMRSLSIAGLALVAIPLVEWFSEWSKEAHGAAVSTENVMAALTNSTGASTSIDGLTQQIENLGRANGELSQGAAVPLVGAWVDSIRNDLSAAETELDAGLARLTMKTTTWLNTPGNFGAGFLGDAGGVAPWASMLDPGVAEVESMVDGFVQAWNNAANAMDQQAIIDKYQALKEASLDAAESMGTSAEDALAGWNYNWGPFLAASEAGVDAMALAGEQAEETAETISSTIGSYVDAANAILSTENALWSLGESLGENGGAWDQYSEAGRANMSALMDVVNAVAAETPGNASAIASNLQALFETIVAGGYASASQLAVLGNIIASLAGGKPVAAADRDFSSLFSGIGAGMASVQRSSGGAARGVGKVKEEVRTLLDYAKDLEGVWSRAFDLRFGNTEALDTIAGSWLKIATSASDAREAVADYQRKLAELTADKSVKQYWLSVAELYDDELRAAELRSELADVNADITKTQKGLTKEQDKASMSLTGNSDAALENRGALMGLVGDYTDLMKSYASSGMSQEQLKAKAAQLKEEFVRQALQLGFSRTEVNKYAAAFDDMGEIIRKVPRNVTVSANVNPALQALKEFESKLKSTRQNAAGGIPIGSSGGYGAGNKYGTDFKNGFDAAIGKAFVRTIPGGTLRFDSTGKMIEGNVGKLRFFDTGGYTGSGGKYDAAGIVHKREFVFSKEATDFWSPQFLSFLHQAGKSGRMPQLSGGVGGSGVVELGPATIHALIQGFMAAGGTYLDGKALADSAGAHFALANRLGEI